MRILLAGSFFVVLLLGNCSSERVPDTQHMGQDTIPGIMDTVPDTRTDTVAQK